MKHSKIVKGAVLTGALLTTGLTAQQVFAEETRVLENIDTNSAGATVSPSKEDTAVQDAEKVQAEAVERANEANRVYDEQARKAEEAKRVLAEKEAQLSKATADEVVANKNLDTAKQSASYQSGSAQVARLGVSQSEEELKHAVEVVTKAEKEDKDTQKAFEEAKKVQADASQRLGVSESAVKMAESAVAKAQAEVTKASQGTREKVQFTKNTIVLNDDFRDALVRYNTARVSKELQRQADWDAFVFGADYSRFDKAMEEARKDILKVNTGVKVNNTYVSDEDALADKTVYSVNNLPREIAEGLSFFYTELVNQVRRQVGTKETFVTKSAVDLADKISKGYQAHKFGYADRSALLAKKGAGHDARAINEASREFGLLTTSKEQEDKGIQYIENANSIGYQPTDPHYRRDYFMTGTLDELKEFVYTSALAMIGTKNDWGHLAPFVGFNAGLGDTYSAMSYSHPYDFTRVHFIGVTDIVVGKSTKFDKTPMQNPYANKANAKVLELARQTLATKVSDLEKAKKVLEGERYKAVEAQSTLNGLEQRKGVLVTAEQDYNRAKDRHANAVSKLAEAEKKESELQALVASRIKVVETAKQAVARAEQAYNEAKAVYEQALRALEVAGANRAEALKALEVARANFEKAKADLLKAFNAQDETTYVGILKEAYDKGQDRIIGEAGATYQPAFDAYKETKAKETVEAKAQEEVTKAETVEKQTGAVLKEQEEKVAEVKKELEKSVEETGLKELLVELDTAKVELEVAKTELVEAKQDEADTKQALEAQKAKETAEKVEIAKLEAEKESAVFNRKEAEKAVAEAKEAVKEVETKVEEARVELGKAKETVKKGVSSVPAVAPVQEELPIGVVPVEWEVPTVAPIQEELPIGVVPVEWEVPTTAPVQEELPIGVPLVETYVPEVAPIQEELPIGVVPVETYVPDVAPVQEELPVGIIPASQKNPAVKEKDYTYPVSKTAVKDSLNSKKVLPNTGSTDSHALSLLGLTLSSLGVAGLKKRKQ